MWAVSCISTMKVDWPRRIWSLAPTRVKMRSTRPSLASRAGTKLPIWAISTTSAVWRRKVDLPPMFGPVRMKSRAAPVAHRKVVRDERLAQHALHDRVAALDVAELVAAREARLHVVEARGGLGERGQHVERGGRARGLLDPARCGGHPAAQRLEDRELALQDQLVGAQHAVLVLLQLGRDEALAARDRLLAHVVGRHERQVRAADLDVVAEDAVEAHLERADPGARALALLDRGDRLAPAAARPAQLVELGVDPVAHEAALAHEPGRLGHERALDLRGHVERRVEVLELQAHERRQALRERLRRGGQRLQRDGERHQVARPGGAERDAAEDAVEVLDACEPVAQPAAVERAERELLDGVEPVLDPLELDERPQDPLAQRPAAHRGPGVVEHVDERAAPAAVRQALDELEVAARERVDREHVLRAARDERRDVGEVALLRLAQVAQGGAGGGGGVRQRLAAEGLEGRDAEVREQLAAGPVEVEAALLDGSARDLALGLLRVEQPLGQLAAAAQQQLARARHAELVAQPLEAAGPSHSATANSPVVGSSQATPRLVGPGSIAITNEVSAAASASGSSWVAGVTTRTTSRLTTPLAVRGSSICSQSATRKPWRTRRAM